MEGLLADMGFDTAQASVIGAAFFRSIASVMRARNQTDLTVGQCFTEDDLRELIIMHAYELLDTLSDDEKAEIEARQDAMAAARVQ